MHRCSKPGGCLSALAKRCPELLDALRERLVKAVEGAKGSRARDDLLPERRAAKRVRVNAQAGKVSASPAMEQALAAMATIRGAAPPTPAAEATAAWQQLQQQGVCVKGCRAFCQGLCGSSNDFGYNKLQRGGGVCLCSRCFHLKHASPALRSVGGRCMLPRLLLRCLA